MEKKTLEDFFDGKIRLQISKGIKRSLAVKPATYADFTSNDYLGLARSEALYQVIQERLDENAKTNGATGSRLLSGNSLYTEATEVKLAQRLKADAALLFNSGYTANLAVLSAIPQKNDTIIYDELAHASIKDGARLSLAKRFNFKHNDLEDLENKIKRSSGTVFIVVESIYSMDGDECPLMALVHLAEQYNTFIILDEAHSTGVMGHQGDGLATSLGIQHKIPVRIHTFGKAMGVHGACVVGSEKLRDYLINFSRPFIYTTALPLHSVIAIDCAFEFLARNTTLQHALEKNITLFLKEMAETTNRTDSHSAIQTFILPGNENVKKAARILQENFLDVRPIVSPTVPVNTERLRICLHCFNTEAEIKKLTTILKSWTSNTL